jgi:hypothetical protein
VDQRRAKELGGLGYVAPLERLDLHSLDRSMLDCAA